MVLLFFSPNCVPFVEAEISITQKFIFSMYDLKYREGVFIWLLLITFDLVPLLENTNINQDYILAALNLIGLDW